MSVENIEELSKNIDWETFNIKNCNRCGLCSYRKNVIVPKIIPNSKIMFIGGYPTSGDDMYGHHLTGNSGQLLTKCLNEVGIDINQYSYGNVVQCHTPQGRPPEKNEISSCEDILDHYIELANPEIIVPLGNVALRRVAKVSGITKYNGKIISHSSYPNVKIVPIVDPAFALRDKKNEEVMMLGLSKVKALLDGNVHEFKSEVTYVDTYDKFDLMMKSLMSKSIFALDIETSTLNDYKNGHIICISFSNEKGKAYVLPWVIGEEKYYKFIRENVLETKKRDVIDNINEFCNFNKLDKPKYFWTGTDVKDRLKSLLSDVNYSKVLHNYAFDYRWLEYNDLKIEGQIYDTMLMHYLLDEIKGTHGLDKCCFKYTPEYGEYWKHIEKLILSQKERTDSYAIIPIDILSIYAGIDADITMQLCELFYPKLASELPDQKMVKLLNNFLMPVTKMLMKVTDNGVKVDQEYMKEMEITLIKEIEKFDLELKNYADINYNSPPQVSKLLFQTLGLPTVKKTESGKNESTDEEVLEVLSKLHRIPEILLTRRKYAKLLSTYVIGIRECLFPDGKVHPNFMVHGPVTGRLAANNPNSQNWPRNPDKGSDLFNLNIFIRNLFISSDSNYVLVEKDYSQAELRLIAEYSKDPNLYNAFIEGRDPHAELAVRIYHPDRVQEMISKLIKPMDIITKEERQNGKTANFELVYGEAASTFANNHGLPLNEGEMIHRIYWDTYRVIKAWQEDLLVKAYRDGCLASFYGRKRRMSKLYSSEKYMRQQGERELLNFVIQAQASDYTLHSGLKISKACKDRGLRVRGLNFVHDSILDEVHIDDLQEFLTLSYDIMLHPPGITVPMESEAKVGTRLGSLIQWENISGIWQEKKKSA